MFTLKRVIINHLHFKLSIMQSRYESLVFVLRVIYDLVEWLLQLFISHFYMKVGFKNYFKKYKRVF